MTLQIRASSEGRDKVLRFFGRIAAEDLDELQHQIDHYSPAALNLEEVILVDRAVVAFLGRCEVKRLGSSERKPRAASRDPVR